MKVDYHMHTLCSDGIYEVETVVDMAVKNGISAMAVTDHDTISGIARARRCCAGRIGYVTGTEITCAEHFFDKIAFPLSIHLLGYGFDETDQGLDILFSNRRDRVRHVYQELADTLCSIGYPISISKVPISCGNVLQLRDVKNYITKTFDQVSPEAVRLINSYAEKLTQTNIPVETGIAAIHHAGGKAVWAHPYHIYHRFQKKTLSAAEVAAVSDKLNTLGIDGMETEYPAFSTEEKSFLNELAAEHGFITTAGSDFHGSAARDLMGMEVSQNSFLL